MNQYGIPEVDNVIADFSERAHSIETQANEILKTIADGCVPNKDFVGDFDSKIEGLRSCYNKLMEFAQMTIPAGGCPVQGDTVYAIASKITDFKKQLNGAKEILEKFISVKSHVEKYETAIQPYQREAEKLLGDLLAGTTVDSDKLTAPGLFLESLETEDFTTNEAKSLIEELSDHYSGRVFLGVQEKMYFLPEKSNQCDVCVSEGALGKITEVFSSETDILGVEKEAATEVCEAAKSETDTLGVEKEAATEVCEAAKSETDIFGVEKEAAAEVCEAAKSETDILGVEKEAAAEACEAAKPETDILGVEKEEPMEPCEAVKMLSSSKKIKNSPNPSATGFKQDVVGLKRFAPDILYILPVLTNLGALTGYQIRRMVEVFLGREDTDSNNRSLLFSLDQLVNKGMIAMYTLEDGQPVYCLTHNCIVCLQKDTVRKTKIWECSFGNHIICGENEMSEALLLTAVNENEKLLSYVSGIKHSLDKEGFSKMESSIKHVEGGYLIGVFAPDFIICTTAEKNTGEYPRLYVDEAPEGDVVSGYLYRDGNVVKLGAETDAGNDNGEQIIDDAGEALNADIAESDSVQIEEQAADVVTDSAKDESLQRDEADKATDVSAAQSVVTEPLSEIQDFIYQSIIDEKIVCASAYAKVASENNTDAIGLYEKLAHAVNDPLCHCDYSSSGIFSLMNETQNTFDYSLIAAASLRTFFSNQTRYDFDLKSLYSGIKDYTILLECPVLSQAMYAISEFKIKHNKGMDVYADYRRKNAEAIEQSYRQLQKEAGEFYDNFIQGKKKESISLERFLIMKQIMFSPNGDIGQFIKALIDGQDSEMQYAKEFLNDNFFEGDSISEETINPTKLWDYICVFWEKAQEGLLVKSRRPLTGKPRNNIINVIKKSVQLLVRWCDLVERRNVSDQDEGVVAYKKIKKSVCDKLEKALSELDDLGQKYTTKEALAGITVLKQTVKEILACILGDYDENSHRYFYAPFLLTDDVWLTDEYLPDMDLYGAGIPELTLQNRLRHFAAGKVSVEKQAYIDRVRQLKDAPNDNYGTAKLLLDFCSPVTPDEEMLEFSEIIEKSKIYAQEQARQKKNSFIGELEFAQANGQIDNSTENTKESMLQIIDNWYEWAVETDNYGVFGMVIDAHLEQIRKSAKVREGVLLGQLEEIKKSADNALSPKEKEEKIVKIKEMIGEQKYTAAEDLLNRFWKKEEVRAEFFEKDFLSDFIDNYEDYLRPVSSHQQSFAVLAEKRGYKKEQKRASDLAKNWLPGGSDLGKERLERFLNLIGFDVKKIDVMQRISIGTTSLENYFVYTKPLRVYSHPIAAFGTGAAFDGFRVVCMTGIYNAEQLISVMKQIGNAKHTMILLDDALALPERRKLARKTKKELGDKFIGVVDRVVMMYMLRNFDTTHNTQMLLSLVAPFGYYQPYIWKSADTMPPELFIGRERELQQIEAQNGVNIVYGGRQLGKSALLKKAKQDIDGDENGDRAIYIDIKSQTYDRVAQTIGHALYDNGILSEDVDTTDWFELARRIKCRLQSEHETPIPLLLLLLDEADTFIESSEAIKYAPFDALKDIQTTNRFKFVVAGLHNVVRFKREVALGNNNVLPHLASMTVKPFSYLEARKLLEEPLHYLGLRFPNDEKSESLIPTILSSTNYFPGLIQLYCAKLLQALRANDYADFNEADSPIYNVNETYIKKVLSDTEFTNEIRQKFEITLGVDEDKYYDVIALIMAYLYHVNGYGRGYDANDIKKISDELGILKISELSIDKLNAFLEELKDLNIFRNADQTHYQFTRLNFYQMMGSMSEVEDKLVKYMED